MNGISANYLGKLYDWGSITANVLGGLQIGVDSIDIKTTQDSLNIYGSGQQPIGYYNKNQEYDATFGFLYDGFQQITMAALALGLTPMQIPPFSIIIQLGSTQDPAVPFKQLTMQNCRITSDNFVAKQNSGGWYNQYPIRYAGLIISY